MRAVICVRVSTSEQVANYSLESQERACRNHCREHGLEIERIFRDEGESAKTTNRPELQAMLDLCIRESKKRNISAVVVYRLDRLTREVLDFNLMRSALRNLGIRIVSATEPFDDSPGGELIEVFSAAMAQYENRVKAVRTIDGMKEGLRKGRWM